ncbi:MAG: amidohydrolase family protein [Phycisphaerales bacterium]|nr:amidohydrolase family protein [Phycisphaerales bacterium]
MNPVHSGNPTTAGRRLIHAAAVLDADQRYSPGSLLLEGRTVVAAGSPQGLGVLADTPVEQRIDQVLMPGLVNAHAHLDLSSLGPVPCDQGFDHWLERIRRGRATDADGIATAVGEGVRASLAGGTVGVGDIGGAYSWVPWETLQEGPILGTSYIEVFGTGPRERIGLEAIRDIVDRAAAVSHAGVRAGLSPHAPHSCNKAVFKAAASSGLPLASHLAETVEELEYCRHGTGPLRDMLERAGVATEGIEPLGAHPLEAFDDLLDMSTWNIAHVNYPSGPGEPEAVRATRIGRLASSNLVVTYCPRASRFFGHPCPGLPGHPWKEMLAAGVTVALGTDGMPCLDTPDRLSILDEMRVLARSGTASANALLAMATVNGARAVGIDPGLVRLDPGPVAGVIAVRGSGSDPVADIWRHDEPPGWILPPEGFDGRHP